MTQAIDSKKEIFITQLCLTATLAILAGLFTQLAISGYKAYLAGEYGTTAETALFGLATLIASYSNILYHICLAGYYKRRVAHTATPRQTLESLYEGKAPSLSTIIPSYKEERDVIWQTMISAALAEYPSKNVVLLIDDPYHAKALADIVKLEETRQIPVAMQALFDAPATYYREQKAAFEARMAARGVRYDQELRLLADHYESVAVWLKSLAADFMGERTLETLPHAERFFVDAVLYAPARSHEARAEEFRSMLARGEMATEAMLALNYSRLVGLFTVNFSSFERKKYSNLSHEANKAMNLNSYIALVGKAWKEVRAENGQWQLIEAASAQEADFTIAHADYINTIDADSLMLSEYALRMIHIMEKPENRKLAVIQSPCSSFPGCPGGVERAAGACIDVQFETHQGYTHWGASFWVGANAMLRREALEEIKEYRTENGNHVAIYIQDRTVIEDTESTIDLVHKGWKLYNYPERMTFSANPPDFGSLLIQRRRWSNGGLLILPKLFNYFIHAPKNLALAKEMFMRFHYLASTSTGCIVALLMLFYPFSNVVITPLLPLSVVPFLGLYMRDLKNAGYKASDLWRICAMNLMLFPVVTGGVFKSFQQMLTGKKIPFGRTPKIPGRTAAPALYATLAVMLPLGCSFMMVDHLIHARYMHAAFSSINTILLVYALVYFIGVRAAFEDMFAGLRLRIKSRTHSAEILPIFTQGTMQDTRATAQQA